MHKLKINKILLFLIATFTALELQYVFGVISPNIRIKNVIIPIAIANPSSPNNFNEISVAKAVCRYTSQIIS